MKQAGKFAKSNDGKRGVPQLGPAASSGPLERAGAHTQQTPAQQVLGLTHTAPAQHCQYSDQQSQAGEANTGVTILP